MKLKYEFIITEVDDQIIAVPVGDETAEFHGIIRLNDSAKAIMDLLTEETTEEEIAQKLAEVYTQSTKAEITDHVHTFLESLKNIGALA